MQVSVFFNADSENAVGLAKSLLRKLHLFFDSEKVDMIHARSVQNKRQSVGYADRACQP
jgi:hypothetical protein